MGVFVTATLKKNENKARRCSALHARRNGTSALGMTVHFCYDDSTKISAFFERATLSFSRLT
jgi:hypothetical protein